MNDQKNITVFGATGKVGKELIKFLSRANIKTIAITRNKNKATEMPFIEWMEADMSDRENLIKTMNNSKAVFLASSVSKYFTTEQSNVIEIAKKTGIGHVIKLSSPGADKKSPNFISRPNGEVEEVLKASAIPWTILQPNSFMQNWLGDFSDTIKKERKIYEATGDGKKPYIDTRDIAEVAFKILTEPEKHIGKIYLLTGGEAINYSQIAASISENIGEIVQFISLTPDEAKQRMEQKGVPLMMINTFLSISEQVRTGKANFVNNAVADILNRKPRTVEAFVNDHLTAFK